MLTAANPRRAECESTFSPLPGKGQTGRRADAGVAG